MFDDILGEYIYREPKVDSCEENEEESDIRIKDKIGGVPLHKKGTLKPHSSVSPAGGKVWTTGSAPQRKPWRT